MSGNKSGKAPAQRKPRKNQTKPSGPKAANHASDDDSLSNIESACLSTVSEQIFDGLFKNHKNNHQSSLEGISDLIRSALPDIDPNIIEQSIFRLNSNVRLLSRGKHLVRRTTSTKKRLAIISQAILTGQCLEGRYNRRNRILHPYALVIREPKIYLLAKEDASTLPSSKISDNSNQSPVIQQYLCNRFEELDLSEENCQISSDFNLNQYIAEGSLDIPITALNTSLSDPFTLSLKLRAHDQDNFIRDLEEFPLANNQSLIKQSDNGMYLLEVPEQRATLSLVEWILARQDRVEVLKPLPLRQYIIARLFAISNQYLQNADPAFESNETAHPIEEPRTHPTGRFGLAATRNLNLKDSIGNRSDTPKKSLYASSSLNNTLVSQLILLLLNESEIAQNTFKDRDFKKLTRYLPKKVKAAAEKTDTTRFIKAVAEAVIAGENIQLDLDDPFVLNTEKLAQMLHLSLVEIAVLRVATLLNHNTGLSGALELYEPNLNAETITNCLSSLTGFPQEEIEHALRDDQPLNQSGLFNPPKYGIIDMSDSIKMTSSVVIDLLTEQVGEHSILNNLSNPSPPSSVQADDLMHIDVQIKHACNLLRGANEQRTKGCNILIWGRPGTGKTEVARYLMQSLGLSCYEIQTTGLKSRSLTEVQRLSSYRLCQSLLAHTRNTAIIFDEVENIISPSFSVSESASKAYVNNTLEDNNVPSIWISNHLVFADPAYLRRFNLIIDLNEMELEAKRTLARKLLVDIPISGELLEDFLLRSEVGPATLQKLKHVTTVSGLTDQQDIDEMALMQVQGDLMAIGAKPLVTKFGKSANQSVRLPYDESLLNADSDLSEISKSLKPEAGARFVLYGPPGTGKTAWASHLADSLGKPSHILHADDIKGMFVGESEKKVAKAFSKAEKENAVLIFDEVDSYLRSRENAEQGHQVDLVNQFLTSMESYNGLLVCSTNLMDNLDTAALRRFDYKIKFDYLRKDQAELLFFRIAEILEIDVDENVMKSANLTLPDNALTPGDFAIQLRRAQMRNTEWTLELLYANLIAEAQFRIPPSKQIGFV